MISYVARLKYTIFLVVCYSFSWPLRLPFSVCFSANGMLFIIVFYLHRWAIIYTVNESRRWPPQGSQELITI